MQVPFQSKRIILTISFSFLFFCLLILYETGASQNFRILPVESMVTDIVPAENEAFFGARMPRTMTLLATSNEKRRYPVKILVYGQSDAGQLRRSPLEEALRKRFPYANITFENHSIAGFSASQLVRSEVHDLYPFYPDLVIFHVYGGYNTGEYERIISNIRRYTTSEILLWTDHIGGIPKDATDAPGERRKREDAGSDKIRYIAQKYNCELSEVRKEWDAYLKEHNLDPQVLLSDHIHFNDKGLGLIATLLARHFRLNTVCPAGWMDIVRTYEAKRFTDEGAEDEIIFTGEPWRVIGASAAGESKLSALKLSFEGNRVDVITGFVQNQKMGTARILIDGKPPSKIPELYAFTLPSRAFGTDWQPAIRRVDHGPNIIPEDWLLKITEISEDADKFTFEVSGSVTGFDGKGTFNAEDFEIAQYGDIIQYKGKGTYPQKFVSNSGRVIIDPRDFKITWAQRYSKKKCPVGFEVRWGVQTLFVDTLTIPVKEDDSVVTLITLAKGLKNEKHTLEIIPNGDGIVPIEEVQVHRPPLR